MILIKRIFLFLIINILVVLTISFLLNLFHVQPYLTSHGLDYHSLLIFCLIWGMAGSFISLMLSKKMAVWLMRVAIINKDKATEEEKKLFNIIEKLIFNSRLDFFPSVGIYQSKEINAFATGPSKKNSLIAVSSALLQNMDENKLEAILAHELSHIENGDMVTMTLLQGIINAFVMFLARVIAFVLSGRQKNSRSNFGNYIIFTYIFEIIFMVLGSIVLCFFSRRREFKADKGGALLSGKEKMIAALQELKNYQMIKEPKEKKAFQAFKISSPKSKSKKFFLLFSTHPSLDDRIKRLEENF